MSFSIGQRWISTTESQLGLGMIVEISGRQVKIHFPAAEEERLYAIDNAPISRLIYKIGDVLKTNTEQELKVMNVQLRQGLIFYTGCDESGEEIQVSEVGLSCFINLNSPEQRLFCGLLEKQSAYQLRIETLEHTARLQQSKTQGLIGSRTAHLEHQVYIASEVAKRYAPRVLLADEVGLGKTIEAGMIVHAQLLSGRAQRVVLVLPETLIHQWLVEMMRRFNLYFTLLNETRYDEEDLDNDANPFALEPLVLCSLEFLMRNERAKEDILSVNWDLLVVDEAHHLHWSPTAVSPEYAFIEALSAKSSGLLLLTATPEQAGLASHFARLRLLDPARFYDFSHFQQEEAAYQAINELVQSLLMLPEDTLVSQLEPVLQEQLNAYLSDVNEKALKEVIAILLDRHGTGRVLFRNTRTAIQGFPKRLLHAYPLNEASLLDWLIETINALGREKVLLIGQTKDLALAVEQHLKFKAGIPCVAFHEGLSLIERDRAAAYFADAEGAQVLVCSEIGSEGRNFQFAHHLILLDLPNNPDLLEQRIGRLDRIGQSHDIQIHVPYLVGSPQEQLFRWYQEGLQLFTQSCSFGLSVYEEFAGALQGGTLNEDDFNAIIMHTQKRVATVQDALQKGRDRLLELSSCNKEKAQALIAEIEAEENPLVLENYMTRVFHEYGVDQEEHSENTEILRPSEQLKCHFPGLKDDGITVTYSRLKALQREDMEFLSFEHPMVRESMEMILDSELGNTSLATISLSTIPAGTLFLEVFYTVNCAAPAHLQITRYLPLTPLRFFMDASGKNLSAILDYSKLNSLCRSVKRHLAAAIVNQIREPLSTILEHAKKSAQTLLIEKIHTAKQVMHKALLEEQERLSALQKENPLIRPEEIDFFKQQWLEAEHYLESSTLKLQALRVIVNKV